MEPSRSAARNDLVLLPPESDLEALGERIAQLASRITAARCQLLVLVREFDQREGWNCGSRSCAHWLNWRLGLAMGAARETVRVALALEDLPRIAAAMRDGALSYSKVRALTRVATAENEAELLAFARAGTASHVERLVRAWRAAERGGDPVAERRAEAERHASRYLEIVPDEDGMVVVRARLGPAAGAALRKALEAAERVLFDAASGAEEVTATQRRADAMGRVAEAALAGGLDKGTRGERYQVVVHVDAAALQRPGDVPAGTSAGASRARPPGRSEVEGIGNVPAETCRRISCDASRVLMTHDAEGGVLDVGRRTRSVSLPLRRALTDRDGHCRFPGCTSTFCDAHHVEHWADGGETKLDNLVLLCRYHHRWVHEAGYMVALGVSGEVRFRRPDGRELSAAPDRPALDRPVCDPDDAMALLNELAAELGVELEPSAGYPLWDGSRFDLRYALASLMN